jgi:hypothetical protein
MNSEDNKIVQQSSLGTKKIKGKADIVFVLDRSWSMHDCIDGIKNNINSFIDSLGSNPMVSNVQWRIGFVAYDHKEFIILNFTPDKTKFADALKNVIGRGNELTLPAIDVALDFPWELDAQRIVILFTDEVFKKGAYVEKQIKNSEELKKKILDLRIKIYYYGKDCPDYKKLFLNLPGSLYSGVNLHAKKNSIDYSEVLMRMGKTISDTLTTRAEKSKEVKKDLYDINKLVKMIYL